MDESRAKETPARPLEGLELGKNLLNKNQSHHKKLSRSSREISGEMVFLVHMLTSRL